MADVDSIAAAIAREQHDAEGLAAGVSAQPSARLNTARGPLPKLEHDIPRDVPVTLKGPTFDVGGQNAHQEEIPGYAPDSGDPVLTPGAPDASAPATPEQDLAVGPGTQAGSGGQGPAPASSDEDLAAQIKQEQDQADGLQAQLLEWRAKNDNTDPGKRAEVLRYSAASGFPPSFVESNLEQVKQKVDAEKTNWLEVAQKQPELVQFLNEKPELVPLVKDDAANLTGLTWALTAPFHAFSDALNEQRTVARQFVEAQGVGSEENRARIAELEQKYSNKDYGADGFWTKGLVGAARMLPFIAGDVAARAAGGALGAFITGGAGVAAGGAAGAPAAGVGAVPGAGVGAVAGAAGGGVLGSFLGSGVFNYYESVGPLYQRISQMKDSDGKPMDPTVARAFAQAGAVVQAGLMAGLMGKVGGQLPGAKQLLERFGAQTVAKALTQQSVPAAMKAGAMRFGLHWLTGAAMMAGQSAIGAASAEGAKAASGQPYDVQWNNVGTAAAQGFRTGLEDVWLISALGPGKDMLKDIGQARASAESTARLESMTASANSSKLLERSPESFQEVVRKMKQEKGAVTNVFIPADEWSAYWQGQKLDPGEVAAQVVGDGGKAYADAVSTKGDIAIPVERYLANLAKTEHAAGLAEHSKLRSDELTPRQFTESQERLKERLKEAAKQRAPELEQGKAEVNDFIREQAVAAGVDKAEAKANAKLVAEYAGAMALRLGVSVREAANMGALWQLRILGPKGEAVAQAARERFQQYLSPSGEKVVRERLASMSPDARVQEAHIHDVTGALDRQTFERTPAPAGMPLVGHVSIEGIKFLNDKVSHDYADNLYRVLAKALHEAAPESHVAFADGDLVLHVADKAQLDGILAKVREALPVKGFQLTGDVGKTIDAAKDVHTDVKKQAEAATPPTRAKRGERPLGFTGEPGAISFPEGRAGVPVPEHIASETRGLSDEEYFKRNYKDASGAWTAKGWKHLPRKANVIAFDLSGLGLANEVHGKPMGDEMIARMKRVAMKVGGAVMDFTHLHGDEYAAQHDNPAVAELFVKRLKEELSRHPVEYVERETGQVAYNHLHFWHGIGDHSYENADRDLNERKALAKKSAEYVDPEAFPTADPRHPLDVRGGGRPGPEGVGGGEGRGDGEGAGPLPGEVPGGSGPVGEGAPGQEVGASDELKKQALADIVRMKPERQALALQWFQYAEGIRSERPSGIPDALKKDLARYGVVDPEGYGFDEGGRSLERGLGGPKVRGVEPAELRKQRLANADFAAGAPDRTSYEQPARGETVAHIEGAPLTTTLFAGEGDSPRGTIHLQLDPTGRPREFAIQVLAGDKSTFLHETAHFLSWSLHDIATSDLATPELQADYKHLLDWAGYGTTEQRLGETKERAELAKVAERTPEQDARLKELSAKEERISHGFEQYLLEGKAPSEGLARVFSRFRDWMLRIYKGVEGLQAQYRQTYGQEIGLSDEVRGIFDRLLAQQDALEQAKADTSAPEPAELFTKSMSPSELDAYRNALAGAKAAGQLELAQRAAELEQHQVGEARVRARAEVTQQVDSQPVYRAMRLLATGTLPEAEASRPGAAEVLELLAENGGKLSRTHFVKDFGAAAARAMPRDVFAKKGEGARADVLAPLLGYEGGKELVDAFTKAEPRQQHIDRLVQEKVDAEYGPALQAIQDAAMSAVHNDAAARATLMELRALAKEVDPSVRARVMSIDLATLKDSAQRLIAESEVGELDPARYARTERITALKAAQLWGAGKKEAALEQREARLFNQILYRAARDAKAETDKAHDRLVATTEAARANLGKADPSYRDVHDALLAAVGIGDAVPEGKTIDQMLTVATEDGQQLDFDVDAVRGLLATPKAWDSLTVDEARTVADAATNIRHVASRTREVELAGKRVDKETLLSRMAERVASVRETQPLEPPGRAAKSTADKARNLKRLALSEFENIETTAHMLDGGDEGPFHELLVDARLECRNKEVELTRAVLEKVKKAFEGLPKELRKRRGEVVDLGGTRLIPGNFSDVYTRDQLWTLFLNSGNEGNLQRLRDGNKLEDSARLKALSLLTKPETDFLQGVLDAVQSLHGPLADAYEKRTGLQLGAVEATPISLNGVEYRGGYFPIKYRSEARQGEVQEINSIKDLFPSNSPPATTKGHTKARLDKVFAPLDLEFGVLQAHLANVIHDISYSDWVRQAGGVILKPRTPGTVPSFSETVTKFLGPEREAQLKPWLRDVASARADSVSQHAASFFDKLGGLARRRLALAAMGFNFPVMGRHSLDAFRVMMESDGISPARVANSYRLVMNPANWSLPEFALSKEIEYHHAKHAENLRTELNRIGGTMGTMGAFEDTVARVAFAAQLHLDAFTSRAAFKAGYDDAIAGGYTKEEAVARADDVVRRAFPSGDIAEKPPIMRTKRGWASALMFYGWASSSYNMNARAVDDASRMWNSDAPPSTKSAKLVKVAGAFAAMGVVEALGMYLAGRGPKKDDDAKERALWAGEEVLLAPLDSVPLVGAPAKAILTGHKINVAADPSADFLINGVAKKLWDIAHRPAGNRTAQQKAWDAAQGLIALLGPAGFAHRTGGAIEKMATGEVRPTGPLDAAGNALYGVSKHPSATPLSDLQDVVNGRR